MGRNVQYRRSSRGHLLQRFLELLECLLGVMVLPVCAINMPLTVANRRGRDGVSIGIIIPVMSSEEVIGTMLANVAEQAHLAAAIKISVNRVSGCISGTPRSHVGFSLLYINRFTANCCRVEMSTYFSYRSTSNMPCIGHPRAQV